MTLNMRDFKTLNLKSESEIKIELEFIKKNEIYSFKSF